MTADAETETKQELIEFDANNITAFDQVKADLAELKQLSSTLVFDYKTAKGAKAARSHIYKLRQSRSALDKARKNSKQAALDYGKAVDDKAKEIDAEILEMIDEHKKPLDEIEAQEAARVAAHQSVLDSIKQAEQLDPEATADEIQVEVDRVQLIATDESLEEFEEQAKDLKASVLAVLGQRLATRRQYEADQEELKRHRQEQEEREAREAEEKAEAERKAEEERIAKEAAEAAEKEAAEEREKREQAIKDAEQAAIDSLNLSKSQAEDGSYSAAQLSTRIEFTKQYETLPVDWPRHDEIMSLQRDVSKLLETAHAEAEEREEQERQEEQQRQAAEAEEKARREAAEEQAAKEAAEQEEREKREADEKHRDKINSAAAGSIARILKLKSDGPHNKAQELVEAIAKGEVPHVSITY